MNCNKWNLREEDYGNLILTDAIEIVIIELPKFEKYMDDTALADWVKFIINPKVIDMSNEEVKKAKEVLDEISQDENERHLAELREKYIMDQKAVEAAGFDKGLECGIEQGFEQGIEQGRKQGIEQGIGQGLRQGIVQTAKKLKDRGVSIDIIIETTGLSIDEISKL